MSTEGRDRRRVSRHDGGPPLRVSGLDALVHDVSRAGVCLQVYQAVQPGTRFALVLTDALSGSSQRMEAEAVWWAGDRAGFRWVGLTPEQDRWLLRCFQSWLGAPVPD